MMDCVKSDGKKSRIPNIWWSHSFLHWIDTSKKVCVSGGGGVGILSAKDIF